MQYPETIVITSLADVPLMRDSMPEKTAGFECTNKLFSFMLDEVHRRERSEKEKLEERVDDYIKRSGVTNCEEIFRIDGRPDLNRDGRPEFVVTSGGHLWATARSDEWTWVPAEFIEIH